MGIKTRRNLRLQSRKRLRHTPPRTLKIYLEDTLIHSQEVNVSYGAQFGPDIDDIRLWQHISTDAVDEWERDNASQRP